MASNHGWLQHATAQYEHTIQQGHTATLGGTQNLSKGQQTDTNCSILHQKVMLQTNERGLLPVRIAFIRIPLPLFISMTVYDSICIIDLSTVCQDTGFGSNFTTAERTSQRSSQKVIKEPENDARGLQLTVAPSLAV